MNADNKKCHFPYSRLSLLGAALVLFLLVHRPTYALEEFELNDYKIQVGQETYERTLNTDLVSCDDPVPREIVAERYFKYWTTAETDLLTEIGGRFVTSASLSALGQELSASLSALVQARNTSTTGNTEGILIRSSQTQTIKPMQCFDQQVKIVARFKNWKLSGTKPGLVFGRNEISPIEIVKRESTKIEISAFYNPKCSPIRCALDSGANPVYGDKASDIVASAGDKNQLWFVAEYKSKTFYVPLYWDKSVDVDKLGLLLQDLHETHFFVAPAK